MAKCGTPSRGVKPSQHTLWMRPHEGQKVIAYLACQFLRIVPEYSIRFLDHPDPMLFGNRKNILEGDVPSAIDEAGPYYRTIEKTGCPILQVGVGVFTPGRAPR